MPATRLPAAVVLRPCAELRPNPRNARTHSKKQIGQIAESIRAFGFVNPVLIDEADMVIAGHGRLAAARKLGHESVPTLSITGLSTEQKRAYVLADNKLAEHAGWDRTLLALELGELSTLMPTLDLGYDLAVTGFAPGEVEGLLDDHAERPAEPEDAVVAGGGATVSRPGDLWAIGPHRVLCGDARSAEDIARLMNGEQTRMVFTDPPYNVAISGHVKRRGAEQHGEFAMASGEMSEAEFSQFLETALGNAVRVSVPGAVHDICMDWRSFGLLTEVGRRVYETLLNVCVWNKGVAGMGSFYRSQHELVAIFRVAGAPHQNNVELGRFGRNRSNVWPYPGVNGYGSDRTAALAMHPTVKPVALVADAIRDCTARGQLVLDPFLGSGTTLIAAEKVGRRCFGLEYDAAYVDLIVSRAQHYSGKDAVLDGDGRSFDEIAQERSRKPEIPPAAEPSPPVATPETAVTDTSVTAEGVARVADGEE